MREQFAVTIKTMLPQSADLRTVIHSTKSLADKDAASTFFDHLCSHEIAMPSHWGTVPPYGKIGKKTKDEVLDLFGLPNAAPVFFTRKRKPTLSHTVSWGGNKWNPLDSSVYSIECAPEVDESIVERWLAFSFDMLSTHEAYYASLKSSAEHYDKNMFQFKRRITEKASSTEVKAVGGSQLRGIPGIYWGNYFSSFYVDWFGRKKFDSLPCVEKKWFDDGSIFFTIAETPFDWDTPEAREMEKAVKEHLGVKAFFDLDTVCEVLAIDEPLSPSVSPEFLQSPRWVPQFPFDISKPPNQPHTKYAPIVAKKFYDDPISTKEELRAAYPQDYTD